MLVKLMSVITAKMVKRETADEVMICNITAIKVKECLADDVIIFEIIASLDG